MKLRGRLLPAILLVSGCLLAADWVTERGDSARTGWQKNEKTLSVANASKLKLLWKRQLEGGLTDPLILGPFITHRGIKELVFVKDRSDKLYAVDADLGRVFWTRSLQSATARISDSPCPLSLRVTPVMPASPVQQTSYDTKNDDDNFSDGNRPLYVLSDDATLFAIRPSTGGDFYPPAYFLSNVPFPISLAVIDNRLLIAVSEQCGGSQAGIWETELTSTGPQRPRFERQSETSATEFSWHGRLLRTSISGAGKLLLADAQSNRILFQSDSRGSIGSSGLATWEDRTGTRWLYVTRSDGVQAFKLKNQGDEITAEQAWSVRNLKDPGAPVIANGVVYLLSKPLSLNALNASTGELLYQSEDLHAPSYPATNLAVANGHICFGTDGALYCFGLPIPI